MKQLFRSTRELILLIGVLFAHLILLSTQVTRAQTLPDEGHPAQYRIVVRPAQQVEDR